MIVKKKIYDKHGWLISQVGVATSIFIYHDVGSAPGYVPWNKIRVAEAWFNQKKNLWQFGYRKLRGKTKKWGSGYEMIGIPIQIFPEVIEAMNNLYAEMRGLAAPGLDSRVGEGGFPDSNLAPTPQQIASTEDEEDELMKKVWGTIK